MGIELGIGETLLVKAIAESTGRATSKIKEDLRKEGDLGKVAMVSLPPKLHRRITEQAEFTKHSANHVQAKSTDCPIGISGLDGDCQSYR